VFCAASTAVFRPILLGQFLGVENVNNSFGLVFLCNGIGSMAAVPAAGKKIWQFMNYK
jgi:hypothetical protein